MHHCYSCAQVLVKGPGQPHTTPGKGPPVKARPTGLTPPRCRRSPVPSPIAAASPPVGVPKCGQEGEPRVWTHSSTPPQSPIAALVSC